MKNSEQMMTISEYIQHVHILLDKFSSEYRMMNEDDPNQYPLQMSKESWNDELFYNGAWYT